MKKILFASILLMNLMAVKAVAQCEEAYALCTKQLSKEDKKAGWNVNKQSQGISFDKGKVYEMTLTAYKGFEYRLLVCTDIDGGTAAAFKLTREIAVVVEDDNNNTHIEMQREVVFDNTVDNDEHYVLFRSSTNKTEKLFLSVSVPTSGKSKSKKLKGTNEVCVGVRLEHRRTKSSSL